MDSAFKDSLPGTGHLGENDLVASCKAEARALKGFLLSKKSIGGV